MSSYIILTLSFLILHTSTFASAKVCIKDGEVEVYSNLIFYGSKAKDSGADCANEIHKMFNEPNATIEINGKNLDVKFKISYQVESEEDVYSSVNINKRIENNYIRIEEKAKNQIWGRSNHSLSGNCGFYAYSDRLGSSTTCAHEYAHGLGLLHYNEKNYNDYGTYGDLRGKGKPGIMAARGFIVDRDFQYNKEASAGTKGGTINPTHRIVRTDDIKNLNIETLNYGSDGCAKLGENLGMAYSKNGEVITGKNWIVWDALKYIYKGTVGDLSESIQCK